MAILRRSGGSLIHIYDRASKSVQSIPIYSALVTDADAGWADSVLFALVAWAGDGRLTFSASQVSGAKGIPRRKGFEVIKALETFHTLGRFNL